MIIKKEKLKRIQGEGWDSDWVMNDCYKCRKLTKLIWEGTEVGVDKGWLYCKECGDELNGA